MVVKKSVVKSVKYLEGKDFEGNFGTLYKYEVVMENGDIGEYSSKSQHQDKFIEGKTTDYDWDTKYPKFPKIKPHSMFEGTPRAITPQNNSNGLKTPENANREVLIIRQVCIKASCEYHAGRNTSTEDVISDAQMFEKYITGQMKIGSVEIHQDKPNDMPF
jgi:hypothetical protein